MTSPSRITGERSADLEGKSLGGRAPSGWFRSSLLSFLFALSGVAALVYEIVWFQLLRLTLGSNSQSLGVLLGCFMGGLFLGSFFYARIAPRGWNPLVVYAVLELGIAGLGVVMPEAIAGLRTPYLAAAGSPQVAFLLRGAIAIGLLLPPTVLMGATLPALARDLRAEERTQRTRWVGRLYAANLAGAVLGTFGAGVFLLPQFGVGGTNVVAVGLNLFVAVLALAVAGAERSSRGRSRTSQERSGSSRESRETSVSEPPLSGEGLKPSLGPAVTSWADGPVYLAYGLSGMASLSCEVLWSRLLSLVFGATVYALCLVLAVFLLGLGAGGAWGSWLAPKVRDPRRGFAWVQLSIVVVLSSLSCLVPFVAQWMVEFDRVHTADLGWLTVTNLLRAAVVVFPGAFLFGMAFPFAFQALESRDSDAARPVGRLLAVNTLGTVVGSLLTSFVLIPRFGTATGIVHLMVLPLAAALVLGGFLGKGLAARLVVVGVASGVAYFTGFPSRMATEFQGWLAHQAVPLETVLVFGVPVGLAVALYLALRRPRWLLGIAVVGAFGLGLGTRVPTQLYMLGRYFGTNHGLRERAEILFFEEGVMEPVVVFRAPAGTIHISINGKVCASTGWEDLLLERLMGHLPALLSRDPSRALVVGLGAGITAGAVSVHERVKSVEIAELEPEVVRAAGEFAAWNASLLDNPKVEVHIDDGRHWIATGEGRYGVITSDPIAPFLAGAAALYTVEYYRSCRERLADGGVFCQWVGLGGIGEEGVRSLLASFVEVFPEGTIWLLPHDAIVLGGRGRIEVDVAELRRAWNREGALQQSLGELGIDELEALLAYYLCSSREIAPLLDGARANRDDNLTLQYRGWRGFYTSDLGQAHAALTPFRSEDLGLFRVRPEERVQFLGKIKEARND